MPITVTAFMCASQHAQAIKYIYWTGSKVPSMHYIITWATRLIATSRSLPIAVIGTHIHWQENWNLAAVGVHTLDMWLSFKTLRYRLIEKNWSKDLQTLVFTFKNTRNPHSYYCRRTLQTITQLEKAELFLPLLYRPAREISNQSRRVALWSALFCVLRET